MKSFILIICLVVCLLTSTVQSLSVDSFLQDDPYQSLNFTQHVNIFDPMNLDTFPQRYFLDTSKYVPGAPIFLYIGGEAPLEYYWASSGVTFKNMANKANGIKLFIEHRYYGTSLPYPIQQFKDNKPYYPHLSTELALEDAIRILLHVVSKFVPKDQEFPRVIAGGGSYAGMLAGFARERYNHLISAAIVSSAPFNIIGQEWSLTPMNYVYFKHVTMNYKLYNPECSKLISVAFEQMDDLFKNGNYTTIQQTLNTCEKIDTDEAYEQAIGWIRSAFIDMAQGNNPNDDPRYSYPVNHACEMMLGASNNPLAGIAKVMDYAFQHELIQHKPTFWSKHFSLIRSFMDNYRNKNGFDYRGKLDFTTILPPHFSTNKSGLDLLINSYGWDNINNGPKCHKMYEEYEACADTSGCGGDMVWHFQVCSQIFYMQSCDCSCMFPGFFHGLIEHKAICKDVFGIDIEPYVNRLGLSFPSSNWKGTSNILFTEGFSDPWCDGGVLESQSDTLLALTTRGGSHHYDLNRPTSNDSPNISVIRDLEYDILMEMAKKQGPDMNKMKQYRQVIQQQYPPICYD